MRVIPAAAMLLFTLVILAGVSSASAAVIVNVDFNSGASTTYSGTAAAPDTGTYWNGIAAAANASLNALKASDGVTVTSVGVAFNNAGTVGTWNLGTPNSLLGDYVYADPPTPATPRTITLSGLTSGQRYDLYLYSGVNGQGTTFTVNSESRSSSATGATAQNPWIEGASYVRFSDLLPDAQNGIVVIWADNTATATATGRHLVNGLQLAAVPEPAGIVAIGLAGLVLAARRRRRA